MMNTVVQYGPKIVQNRQLVKLALAMGENYLIKDGKNRKKTDHTLAPGVIDDQTAMSLAILHSVSRVTDKTKAFGCNL